MRTIMLAAALAAPLGLLGCATGQPQPTYGEQVSSLTADCQARGGILTPIDRKSFFVAQILYYNGNFR